MSAAGDETRKGEAITNAAATRSVMPQADGNDSIALQRDSSPPQFSWSRGAHERCGCVRSKKATVGELFMFGLGYRFRVPLRHFIFTRKKK